MNSNYPIIPIYKYNLYFTALEDMVLPEYQGSMFRGAFGHSFKKVTCVIKNPTCEDCMLKLQCIYFAIFETELEDNNIWYLKSVKKIPHPFVIQPDPENKQYTQKGDIIKVGLTLFGRALIYLPYFIYTFKQMAEAGITVKRAKTELTSVENITKDGPVTIYASPSSKLINKSFEWSAKEFQDETFSPESRITIDFISPFRVQEKNKVLTKQHELTPLFLIRNIERRIYSIATLFCENKEEYIPEEFENDLEFTENKLYYYSWERYSSRQKAKIGLGGYKGSLTLKGNLEKYYPLFKIGEMINIGKNTVFGLGKYTLTIK